MSTKPRSDIARSYRFDPETAALIQQLCQTLRDPLTGRPRKATDILRMGVRVLAKKHLPAPVK